MVCKPKALIAGRLTVSLQTPQLRYGHYGDRLSGRANIYNVLPLVKKKNRTNKLKLAFFGLTLYLSYVITNLFYA